MNADATWPDVAAAAARHGRPTGWRRLGFGALVFFWIAASAGVVVSHKARSVSLGYELARASAEERRLLDERRSLQLEEASLRSPLRVGVAAAQRMGLRPPAPREIRRIMGTPPRGLLAAPGRTGLGPQ
jgi:cell division protein FtsL